jgi:hypothetical protein
MCGILRPTVSTPAAIADTHVNVFVAFGGGPLLLVDRSNNWA